MPQISTNKDRIEHLAERNTECIFRNVCASADVFRAVVHGDNDTVSATESSHVTEEEPSLCKAKFSNAQMFSHKSTL